MAKDAFDTQGAIEAVGKANEGINFDNKVQESVRRSTDVQKEIKGVVWTLFKEKIAWIILGAFSFVVLELLKELASKLISKI